MTPSSGQLECQVPFENLKTLLTFAYILAYPSFGSDSTFTLETNASHV